MIKHGIDMARQTRSHPYRNPLWTDQQEAVHQHIVKHWLRGEDVSGWRKFQKELREARRKELQEAGFDV